MDVSGSGEESAWWRPPRRRGRAAVVVLVRVRLECKFCIDRWVVGRVCRGSITTFVGVCSKAGAMRLPLLTFISLHTYLHIWMGWVFGV